MRRSPDSSPKQFSWPRFALVTTLLLVGNNSLESDWRFIQDLYRYLRPPGNAATASRQDTAESTVDKWVIPPTYRRGWLNDFLAQNGRQEPILQWPDGVHKQVWALTTSHPVLKNVVRKAMQNLVDESSKPQNQPTLLGNLLLSIYEDCQSQIAFPPSYSEADKTQVLLDLTNMAALAVSDQYIYVADARSLGVLLPASIRDENEPVVNVYFTQLPIIFSAPRENCADETDCQQRTKGHDRSQHLGAYKVTHDQGTDYFARKGQSRVPITSVHLGQTFIEAVDNLPLLDDHQKADIVDAAVSLGWELGAETARRFYRDLRDLSPLEFFVNAKHAWPRAAVALKRSFDTGILDTAVTLDSEANIEGANQNRAMRQFSTDAEVRKYLLSLNNDDRLNGRVPAYDKNDWRVKVFQQQQAFSRFANSLKLDGTSSMSNQSVGHHLAEIAKKLEETRISLLPR